MRNDGRGDRSDTKAYRIGAYGRFSDGPIGVDGVVGYGKVEYETDRRIVFGAINRTAHGDYSGDQFTAHLIGRYRVEHGPYGIEPFAGLQYVRESQDDFVETGADSINLAVAGRTLKSTRGTLGARVDRSFETAGGKGMVEIRAGYSHEFSGVPSISATLLVIRRAPAWNHRRNVRSRQLAGGRGRVVLAEEESNAVRRCEW